MKCYIGKKPGDGGLQSRFTTPLRLPSISPFPALLFSLPWGTKRTWMQQPFWDSVLLNCADCEEAACKQQHCGSIQSGLYSRVEPPPPTRKKRPTSPLHRTPPYTCLLVQCTKNYKWCHPLFLISYYTIKPKNYNYADMWKCVLLTIFPIWRLYLVHF